MDIIQLEHDLLPVVLTMEMEGIKIDQKKLSFIEQELLIQNKNIVSGIQGIVGSEINLNSTEQLNKLLFEDLGLKSKEDKLNKKGGYPVDRSHLEQLKDDHEIIPLLLDYRKIQKLLDFCKQLAKIHPKILRLHGNFNQIGTATGRFSCSSPNLQNIPSVKGDANQDDPVKVLTFQLREVFIPKRGCVFIGADYSQIELRITAELSQDPFLLKAYNEGNEDMDIHKLTASEIFSIKSTEVTEEQRSIAKSINFGLIYGKTPTGLAKSLTGITGKEHSIEQAEKIMQEYFNRFGKVKACLEGLINSADQYGYSSTLFGRQRPIPELNSPHLHIREKGKRLAMNSPIQGTAADIIKMAMVACDKAMAAKGLKSRLVLQVHDELLFEVPEKELEIMKELVKHEMENVVKLSVPLKIDLKTGKSWREVH